MTRHYRIAMVPIISCLWHFYSVARSNSWTSDPATYGGYEQIACKLFFKVFFYETMVTNQDGESAAVVVVVFVASRGFHLAI